MMPVHKRGSKWAIGHGKAIYKSKRVAMRAYRGYMAAKHMRAKGIPPKKRRR
jgi:hypothetical protein